MASSPKTKASNIPVRLPHQARLVTTLSPHDVTALCSVLYMPAAIAPSPTSEWLASQGALVEKLPSKLRRMSKRDGTSRFDGQTILCVGHTGLNGYVISALIGLLCDECTYYNEGIHGRRELGILSEIMVNKEDTTFVANGIAQGTLTGELYVGNRCSACVLAAIASNREAVEVLTTAMTVAIHKGLRKEISVLSPFLGEWAHMQGLGLGEKGSLYKGLEGAWDEVLAKEEMSLEER